MKKIFLTILILLSSNSYANSSIWECIGKNNSLCNTWRSQTPSGWVVASGNGINMSLVYVPDKNHKWAIK